jgi:dTDP-4-amino-4,6-dideoxygalactose transaminase/intein/homing endonuclease
MPGEIMIPVCEPKLSGKELEYVIDCIRSNWISSKGKYITEFEEKFSRYCGAKYGIATCNGTAALHLALASLGIGPGDEVLCPAFTMIATANSITYTGAKPVLVDSEPETWNIDPSKIEEKITDRTKAIMVMHTYGHPCLTGDIQIVACNGGYRKNMSIRKAVEYKVPYVLGVKNGKVQPVRVYRHSVRLWSGKIIEVKLENDTIVKATPEHLFPTYARGWIPIIQATTDDHLYTLKCDYLKGRNNETVDAGRKGAAQKSVSFQGKRGDTNLVSKLHVESDSTASKQSRSQEKVDVDIGRNEKTKRGVFNCSLEGRNSKSPSEVHMETNKAQSTQLGSEIHGTITDFEHYGGEKLQTDEGFAGSGKSLSSWTDGWRGNNNHNKTPTWRTLPPDLVVNHILGNPRFYSQPWDTDDNPKEKAEKKTRDLSIHNCGLHESAADIGAYLPIPESQEATVPFGDEIYITASEFTSEYSLFEGGFSHLSKTKGVKLSKIRSINFTERTCLVYDLTTESGNFFANGVLVHNCDMDPILEIARNHDLYVVEDAAEAHGAEYKGKRVGALGDAGCFSFYANKIVTSVSGDEPLITMDESGLIQVLRTCDFIDRFFSSNETGEVPVDGFYAPVFDRENYSMKWAKIKSVIRHRAPERVYRIHLKKGRTVTVTGNHSLFVKDNGRVVTREASMLKKGDLVAVPIAIPPASKKVSSIDVLRLFLSSLDARELNKLRVAIGIANERLPSGKHYTSVGLARLKNAEDLQTWIMAKGQGKGGGSAKIRLPTQLPITRELCRFLGYYAAEGSISHRGLSVILTFGPEEDDLVQDCISCVRSVFPDSSVKAYKRKDRTDVVVNGKVIGLLLQALVGKGAKHKHLPYFIYNIPPSLQIEFLDAYVKGDGCARNIKGSDRIDVKTVSRDLATGIHYLHLMLGLSNSVQVYPPGIRDFGTYVSHTAEVYNLSIGGIKGNSVTEMRPTHKNVEELNRMGEISFLEITEIEEIPPPTPYVYDLSCPPDENFIGGFGAVFLHNTGEGGMVVTNDEEIAKMCRLLRDQAFEPKRFLHRYIGFNYRMTNLQAAIGAAQMEIIDESVETRRRNARLYNSLLRDVEGITLPPEAPWAKNVYWMYTILVEDSFGMGRDDLMAYLKEKGIDTRSAFYPIHVQPVYQKLYAGESYPVAEELGRKGINLPSGNTLTEEQIKYIAETVASAKR